MHGEGKLRALKPGKVGAMLSNGAYIADLREPAKFGRGYLRGSINIQFSSQGLEERIEMFIPPESPLILVADREAQVKEASPALKKTRGQHLLGYTHYGVDAWANAGLPVHTLEQMSLHELKRRLDDAPDDIAVLDVREAFEWELFGYIEGALLIPLAEVERRRNEIPQGKDLAVICEIGVRSSTAATVLERHGFTRCSNVFEGMHGWREADYPTARYRGG